MPEPSTATHLGLDVRGALARLDMIDLGDHIQLAIEVDRHPGLQLVRLHSVSSTLGGGFDS
jgi:hypothetical protein